MKIIRKTYDRLFIDTTIFIYCSFTAFLLNEIMSIHSYIGEFMKGFIVWGGIIIAANILEGVKEKKRLQFNKYFSIIFLFILSYLVTIFINREQFLMENIKIWLYMIVLIFVLYGLKEQQNVNIWNCKLKRFFAFFLVCTFILSTICLLTYVFQINILIDEPDGYSHIGMYDNRLWGIYNPNVGSSLNALSIIISCGFLIEKKNKKITFFLIINLLLQYIHLLLTGSRTSFYTTIAGVALFGWFSGFRKIKTVKRTILCIGVALMIFFSYNPVRNILSYLPIRVNSIEEVDNNTVNENKQEYETTSEGQVDLERLEKKENRSGGVLTGRTYIWSAGLQAWREHPLFGISKAATYEKASVYIEDPFWLPSLEASLHNIYITILVASGIVGLVFFMAFLIANIINYIKRVFREEKDYNFNMYITLLILLAIMLVTECMEGRIVYRTEVFNVLFWTLLGFASQFSMIKERDEMDDKKTI